ncbi:serine/threonine protein kinase, partial [Oleoguttula sp. CCFEE 5521]
PMSVTDSTDGLTGALAGLDFTRRKPVRERTLLSSINEVRVGKVLDSQKPDQPAVKVWDKNAGVKKLAPQQRSKAKGGHFEQTLEQKVAIEERPDAARDPQEFMGMGGKGDEQLFEEQTGSIYPGETIKEVKEGEK